MNTVSVKIDFPQKNFHISTSNIFELGRLLLTVIITIFFFNFQINIQNLIFSWADSNKLFNSVIKKIYS